MKKKPLSPQFRIVIASTTSRTGDSEWIIEVNYNKYFYFLNKITKHNFGSKNILV